MSIDVVMPRLGWTMEEGQVVEWYKSDGDFVEEGDILFAVEADKGVSDIEALESGVLHILPDAPYGTNVSVGTRLAYIADPSEAVASAPETAASGSTTPEPTLTQTVAPIEVSAASEVNLDRQRRPAISPRAKRRARELGVEWEVLEGTGRAGRIVERDVLAVHEPKTGMLRITPMVRRLADELDVQLSGVPVTSRSGRITRADVRAVAEQQSNGTQETGRRVELAGARKTISRRMFESARTAAPVTLTTEADATELVALRRSLKAELNDTDTHIPTITDLLTRLTALALVQHPDLNASLDEDEIVVHDHVNIGVAVDSPHGLVVPVIRDAHQKSAFEIADISRGLIAEVRGGRIASTHLQGGTFTISNLGMFDIDFFTPIINLPECAVLGVGRIVARPVVLDEDADETMVRKMMALSLTFDHRLVDGAPAARVLQQLKNMIERPVGWLMR
ncbi:MAG: 2-oxo acid dehydrogenase subunit E2 [Chloroflexia bacterium]|nr:2-oxo acid dehydrogenase subunit E2 [Chloroflexia bacterium]